MTSHEPEQHRSEQHRSEDTGSDHSDEKSSSHERRMYLRFGAMIATSAVVMFVLMYHHVYTYEHVRWSDERFYMALLMAGAMALVMLAFMRSMMYKNRTLNIVVVAVAVLLGGAGLFLSRSQVLVDDRDYMKAMIPHHSIAILTSERADIDDVRVRELADKILVAQRKEIKEMDWLIEDIEENGLATTEEEAQQRPLPEFEGQAASYTPTTVLATVLHLLGQAPEHHAAHSAVASTR